MEKLRKQLLEAKLKDAPEKLKTTFLKHFERMSFKDDQDFDSYIQDVEKDLSELNQDIVNSKGAGKDKKKADPEETKEQAKKFVDEFYTNR